MLEPIQVVLGKAFMLDAEDLKRQEGQTATEYAVVIGVIVIGVGGAAMILRDQLVEFIKGVGAGLAGLK